MTSPNPAAVAATAREPKTTNMVEVTCKDCGDKFQVSLTWLKTENITEPHCGWCSAT